MMVENAWLFDIDGVLTNPKIGPSPDSRIFFEIAKRLKKGEPVGFNTGRSVDFIFNIISALLPCLPDRQLLRQVMASGEKGAVTLYYNQQGDPEVCIDPDLSMPPSLQVQVAELVARKYDSLMLFDQTKQTMISVEMKPGVSFADFTGAQKLFIQEIEVLLADQFPENRFVIDPSIAAIDVQNSAVGKQQGTRKFTEWLAARSIVPNKYIAFGDSVADLAMGEALSNSEVPFEFVFVGNRQLIQDRQLAFTPLFPEASYNLGTLEFLKKR